MVPESRLKERPHEGRTRQFPLPEAHYEYQLSTSRWNDAEIAGQPPTGEFQIKHTEKLLGYVEQILGRLEAELKQWRKLPSEDDIRARLSELALALDTIASLWDRTPEADLLRRALERGLQKQLNECVATSDQAERVRMLIPRGGIVPGHAAALWALSRSAVQNAQAISSPPLPRGPDPSIIEHAIKELGWVYCEAGGRQTGGSNFSKSFFARWATKLLEDLPPDLIGVNITQINNLARNLDWSETQKPQWLSE